MTYYAKVIADSLAPCWERLTTMEICFPRVALSEFNTHRIYSRNSASSRAIPVAKMLQRIQNEPFIPEFTGAQKGMQGKEVDDAEWQARQERRVLAIRDFAAEQVQSMLDDGVAKQDANRYIEPFMWHTVIVSSVSWENFFDQRCSPLAYPPIRIIAEMMRDALEASVPLALETGEWHLPYVTDGERCQLSIGKQKQLSVARSARVSYLSHDGKHDPAADYSLYAKLLEGKHFSPFEHVAQALDTPERNGNFTGFRQHRKEVEEQKAGAVANVT